jgi:hypothetical protein
MSFGMQASQLNFGCLSPVILLSPLSYMHLSGSDGFGNGDTYALWTDVYLVEPLTESKLSPEQEKLILGGIVIYSCAPLPPPHLPFSHSS